MPQGNIGGDNMDSGPKSWTEVVRKKPAKKVNPTVKKVETDGMIREGTSAKQAIKQQRTRSHPSAILVKVGTDEFPELAKKIRGGVNSEIIGNSVVSMRQAKSGSLLIEVRGDQTQVEAVRAEVARSAGSEVEVRALQQRALVEICDLDQWTTPDEIVAAMSTAADAVGRDVIKVVSLRKRFGGSQTALVSISLGASRGLINSGRLLVGMVCCRDRMADPKVRCFRCLSWHMAKDCGGPDRTNCCRRCGEAECACICC